ncbi:MULTISPECIES: hypothetical protein [Gordonia]|uniref:Uncharacterized protein n=1 Tax=Gordonia terrae C-6 TaxID=1316928 RepID=R7Y477_9ACTN|nr:MULTISPECIES: hypothetical protein [Gordonia]EON30836.1 hypothetical protein GTC6_20600 [Gordonia terrae C-6]
MVDSPNAPGRHGSGENHPERPIPGADDPTQIIPTQGIPPQDPSPPESPAAPDRRRRFDWGHIARTRVRTSTAILVAVFLACCVLYGYTSQRYGVVAPAPARPAPTTSQTVEPTYEPPPTTSSTTTTSTEPSTTDTTGGVEGTDGTSTDGTGSQTPSTSRETIPGLPNIPFPNFGGQTPTTTVPTR